MKTLNENQKAMKTKVNTEVEVMTHLKSPLTGDWLCKIKGTSIAYYLTSKKGAEEFCNKVNKAFETGVLKFDEDGYVVKGNVS